MNTPQHWEAQADFKEYMSAVNPVLPKIAIDFSPSSLGNPPSN
ncbi:MAG: hypothetical protein ABL915_03560 [Gallionella sp.]